MGVIYRIKFPDGSFYIGATINLENRMMQHRYHATNKLLKAKIKEFKMSKPDFIQLFTVLHEGEDFQKIEREIIYKLRLSPMCLNMSGVRKAYSEKICRRIIQCSVEYDIYCLFGDIEKELKTNTEGAINHLVLLHKAELIKQAERRKGE